jgi:DNA-binding MarR family transcriptional regulator
MRKGCGTLGVMAALRNPDRQFTADVDAVLTASRVLVGVAARSIATIPDDITLPQLRALMILATRGPLHLTALAADIGVHPSNATRACDRLVAADLIDRRDNPIDRRHLLLELTPTGRDLIDGILVRRRIAIEQILRQMPTTQGRQLGQAMTNFAAAGGEPNPQDLWTFGWIS